jgi:hypothetical protein
LAPVVATDQAATSHLTVALVEAWSASNTKRKRVKPLLVRLSVTMAVPQTA